MLVIQRQQLHPVDTDFCNTSSDGNPRGLKPARKPFADLAFIYADFSRARTRLLLLTLAIGFTCADVFALSEPFAYAVIAFDPAPGQFVNDAQFNDPGRALGRPFGGGIDHPDNTSIVSLGGFGGSIILAFDHRVMDDVLNPHGMDAIVFGNAFWPGGDPNRHWAEVATIEVSLDENDNGLADDAWYLIPGLHIANATAQWQTVTWDDDTNDATYPPSSAAWIPPGMEGMWTTGAFALPVELFGTLVVVNPVNDGLTEGVFGYADFAPTLLLGDLDADDIVDDAAIDPEVFYTTPDDPLIVGISPGSGGGDAFDIAWAIDSETGEPALLPGFDFIRITSAVNVDPGPLGEKSTEIDAVADAAPDPFGDLDQDGDIDLLDVAEFHVCFAPSATVGLGCSLADRQPDDRVDETDIAAMLGRITGPIQ